MNHKNKNRRFVIISLFAALLCAISLVPPIPIPGSPVPITAQTFAIFLVTIVGGIQLGTTAVGLYVLMGIIGLPIFSGGSAGIPAIFGPTGGYILGFIPGSFLLGLFAKHKNILMNSLGILLCITVLYAWGTFHLSRVTGMDIHAAFAAGSAPFILPDLIKAVAALFLGKVIRKRLTAATLL